MTSPLLRERYLGHSVTTASPGRLLVMLYQRLARDLRNAEQALRAGDRATASDCLMHGQEIVIELRASLDLKAWDGAVNLAKIYGFLLSEMVGANIRADADRVAGCLALVNPLVEAWQEALATLEQPAARPVGAGSAQVA